MKNDMKLYSLRNFDRSAKVRWLLKELGVDYTSVELNREKKENEAPEYLKLNPMGRVPVFTFGDQSFYESGAICVFIADRFGENKLAPSIESPFRGKYLQWMFFATAMLDTIQIRIMVIEDIPAGPVRSEKETALLNDLRDAMEAMNQELKKGDYLVDGKFSAADICNGYHLFFLTLWPELNAVIQDFPKVVSYLERLKSRPGVQGTGALYYEG